MQISNKAWATFAARNDFQVDQVVMFLLHSLAEMWVPTNEIKISVDMI
jgi:hypothetical protein